MPQLATYRTNVFVNIPYDKPYEKLYLAIIAGLAGLGLRARCTLEIQSNTDLLRVFINS